MKARTADPQKQIKNQKKHLNMPSKQKIAERPKTRKELRKDKRSQKKANRAFFHKRKKELKIEYRARLKQSKTKKGKVNEKTVEKNLPTDAQSESEEEMEYEHKERSAPKSKPVELDRLQQDVERERQKKKKLEKEMKKQRARQLEAANEEEDKVIRRLEKQLKIDRTRSEKHVPKMFNDGLEYALELCLPENIQKMYAAAKEAAQSDSDNGFEEDLQFASGVDVKIDRSEKTKVVNDKKVKEKNKGTKLRGNEQIAKLRKLEGKFFDVDGDLDSDLSEVDSEFEGDNEEEEASDLECSDLKSVNSDSDDDDEESEMEEDAVSSDEAPEERPIGKNVNAKHQKKKVISSKSESDLSQSDSESNASSSAEQTGKCDNDSEDDYDESEDDGLDEILEDLDEDSDQESKPKLETSIREDIYGRKRDKDGKIIPSEISSKDEKYIPPHVRARIAAESGEDPKRLEKLNRLKKQLKGWLNRLSEANMHKIVTDIDNLYMQNPRYDMNITLTSLIIDSLVSNALAPERMVLEHMLLVAVLHANVGSEVGAHFLQAIIEKLNIMLTNLSQYEVEDKQLDNVIFIICHMYTFKIFHHSLIFEILRKLVVELCEKSVECVLLTLKSIGFALRKDDPTALKELISTLQTKTNEASEDLKNNTRLKYMLDVLLAIKNNNVNKIPQYDPSVAEHLRKILKSLLVNGKYVTTLNITLEDLLKADQRGKWWVVGSAWSGNVDDIGGAKTVESNKKEPMKFSEEILATAKKQRMNTDDRRNVFCVLYSDVDYIEKFEKLHKLGIKDHRVIVTVIIHCCVSGKNYEPFFALLAQKFCETDRKYQLAVQFALWDRIKDIKSYSTTQIRNLAQYIIYLIENGGQPLSVLKIVEFAQLDKTTLSLVRRIVSRLLLNNEDTCKQVFQRIAPSVKLKTFKESIRLFMHHFLLKGGSKSGIPDNQLDILKKRIAIADKAMETVDSRIQF